MVQITSEESHSKKGRHMIFSKNVNNVNKTLTQFCSPRNI